MRIYFFASIFIIPLIFCIEENFKINYDAKIEYKEDHIIVTGEGIDYNGTTLNITSSGTFLISGICNEGNINIYSDSVKLFLENLELSSSITSPIYIYKNFKDIEITAINNVNISDYEEIGTTGGDCAAIKIKKNTTVSFYNQNDFYIKSTCKNAIKGASQVDLKFETSPGKYIIDAFHNGIVSEGLIFFNGGKFNITTEIGDGIQAKPDKNDTVSLGEIIIKDGDFYIRSHCDAFQARNRIEIVKGNFNIKTEEGFNSSRFDRETGNSKAFEVTNDQIGSEIKIYDGNFLIDTPDDSFNSEGNLTLINGEYTIYSGDDGIKALNFLFIGEKNSSNGPNINIKISNEGIESKNIIIYSGKINIKAEDDGINSSEENKKSKILINLKQNFGKSFQENLASKPILSVYGGELSIIYNSNGLDSNGDIELFGGEISLIKGEKGINPVEISGTFKLSQINLISIGNKGQKPLNEIIKGNQKYAIYNGDISKNKILKIENENKAVIKVINIIEEINNIFYTSVDLNEKYTFYIFDSDGSNEKKLSFEFGKLKEDYKDNKNEDNNDNNFLIIFLSCFFGVIVLLIAIFFVYRAIKRNK